MAVKGTILKKEITDKMLEVFPGSFLYNEGKEIRIPGLEEGQELQIKVSLTCAKTNVTPNGDSIMPGAELNFEETSKTKTVQNTIIKPTQEEKDNVKKLMASLGL